MTVEDLMQITDIKLDVYDEEHNKLFSIRSSEYLEKINSKCLSCMYKIMIKKCRIMWIDKTEEGLNVYIVSQTLLL